MGSKYTYQEGATYKSESTPITIRNFPTGKYRITATYNGGEASAEYETAIGTTDIGLNISYGYGFAAVDVAINTSDPTARCTYPQTITVNGQTVNNSCYGFTPAKSASNSFDMGSWASHKILEGIKPVMSDGAATPTFTDAPKDASTWTTGTEYFTEFPFNWLSITNDGTRIRIIFSDKPDRPDSSFQSYAFRKANGTDVANAFHLGCFGANGSTSAIYSKAATTYTTNITYAGYCQGANARGDQYDIMSHQQWTYLQALFILLYKSTDSQTAHSYGNSNGSKITTNAVLSTTNYGMAGSTSSARNAFFWIHDIWGNIYQFIGGLFVRAGSTKTLYYLLARQSQDSSFNAGMSSATSSYATQANIGVSTGLTSTGPGGYISTVCGTNEGGFAPIATSGSESTYFADYGDVYSTSSRAYFPCVGGGYDRAGYAGLFCCLVSIDSTRSSSDFGSRLAFRGGR